MNERDIPFLNELRAELRRATQQDSPRPARRWVRESALLRMAAPALVAIAALVYVLAGLGGAGTHRPPVRDYNSSAAFQPQSKVKLVGSRVCTRLFAAGRHVPPLVHSNSAPDQALISELSMLRRSATPIDSTSLGSWDREFPMILTVFQRYVRVFNGPKGVRLAYLPVSYCSEPTSGGPAGNPLGQTAHVQLQQGLVMLVLSNPGEHPAVLVGTAQQIKHGPALAGLDLSHQPGWVQTIVVPDGVSRVVMKFTPPFLHHYSNTVQIQSNVGIVVRKPDYTPTTVIEYAADGKVLKRFVYRKEIATDNCLAHHRKNCFGPAPSRTQLYGIPVTSPADPQAKALYAPLIAYARSTALKRRAGSGPAGARVGQLMNVCDKPYQKQLFLNLVVDSKNKAMQRRYKLYQLWNHVTLMQTYQADIAPVAPQLRQLVASWAQLSQGNKVMNEFAHAVAAELNASLSASAENGCAFVRGVAVHHFSYAWARTSLYGRQAARWWAAINSAGDRTAAFWKFVSPPLLGHPGGAGQHLFTTAERSALANLPGELG